MCPSLIDFLFGTLTVVPHEHAVFLVNLKNDLKSFYGGYLLWVFIYKRKLENSILGEKIRFFVKKTSIFLPLTHKSDVK